VAQAASRDAGMGGDVINRNWAGEVRNVSVRVATGVGEDGIANKDLDISRQGRSPMVGQLVSSVSGQ